MIDMYGQDFVDNMSATKSNVRKMYKADYVDMLKEFIKGCDKLNSKVTLKYKNKPIKKSEEGFNYYMGIFKS